MKRKSVMRNKPAEIVSALVVCLGFAVPTIAHAATSCDGRTATIEGTDEADALKGTPDDDVIAGLGGDDEIEGLDGNDVICGGPGRDLITAGTGDAIVFGGDGNDSSFLAATIVIGEEEIPL